MMHNLQEPISSVNQMIPFRRQRETSDSRSLKRNTPRELSTVLKHAPLAHTGNFTLLTPIPPIPKIQATSFEAGVEGEEFEVRTLFLLAGALSLELYPQSFLL
jgi:hypothetical protein